MREDELSRLGREVGRAVRNVLNSKDFDDLRTSIDSAVRNIGPVSYTHLDVYKRQGYSREER